jgi:hypothetical protein
MTAALATIALCAISALPASPASAADRYVTPGGTNATNCPQVDPCTLATGINNAVSGDVVHVDGDSGIYQGVTAPLTIAAGVTVLGEGVAMPRVAFASPGNMSVSESGSVVRLDLGMDYPGVALLVAGVASQVRVELSTGLPMRVEGLVRDSFARSENGDAIVALGKRAKLRNVTALATGANSTAINYIGAPSPGCGPVDAIEIRNTIARGAQHDLRARNTNSDCALSGAVLDVGHSNFRGGAVDLGLLDALLDAGGNQTSVDPLLAADGFHQLAGSPTIDAGIATPENGPADIDGEARLHGAAPDIGADEYHPPVPHLLARQPVAWALKFNPRRFLPKRTRAPSISATKRKPGKRSKRTSRVRYRLTVDARVRFAVQRKAAGRRKGKRCVIGKRAQRLKGKRCARFVKVRGAFFHAGRMGANRFRFTGFIGGKRLKPGAHRMVGVPTDATGNRGRAFRGSFVIARR